MRVLLISANREEINMRAAPLGLACVAAATEQAGHESLLLDLMAEDEPRLALQRAVAGFQPEIIGVSVRNIDDQRMTDSRFLLDPVKELVADCRCLSEAPVILGGAGYSIFPETALAYVGADMGIQGEGEIAFPALIERIGRKDPLAGSPGLYLPGRGLQGDRLFAQELDSLPLPAPRILSSAISPDQESWLPVQTRRGCPMGCSYCSTATIEGRRIRQRSPAAVVRWLSSWADAGFRRIYFVDNIFNIPPSYARGLCSQIIEASLGLTWRAILYPGRLEGRLVRQMARAGCGEVSVGFESGAPDVLRRMRKRFTPEDVRLACRMLADEGIRRMGFLLLGGPGETRETVEEGLAFADSLGLDALKITVGIRIYPHTDLARMAVAQGMAASEEDLLYPRFYVVPGLESWLHETVARWMAQRPNWMT